MRRVENYRRATAFAHRAGGNACSARIRRALYHTAGEHARLRNAT